MCSITPPAAGPVSVAAFGAAVDHVRDLVDGLATALGDPARFDLGSVHPDVVAELTTTLLRVADRVAASASATAGHVIATTGTGTGTLVAGRFASPRRWLEVEAGLSASAAKAVLARARDLSEHSGPVRQAWLDGEVSGDAVRELTSGVTGALATVSAARAEKQRLRDEAIEVLLPVARAGTVGDVKRAVGRLRLLAESAYDDPEREKARAQAAVEAYDDQTLTCVQVGDHSILTARLTHESAAAAMTVIDAYARRIADRDPAITHDVACPLAAAGSPAGSGVASRSTSCTCGASAAAGVVSTRNWPHLRAVAFGELMTDQLDDARVGSHHGIAPHVTVTVDLDHLVAGLGGDLTMPGTDDPVLLPSSAVRRILCDASITPVVVQKHHAPEATGGADHLARLLLSTANTVLYVGRTRRTATAAQRRALEIRDRHCIFPGCRAHPRRCQAHHIVEWENQGGTDLSNLALLCVRHHTAVHEGRWTVARTPGTNPHQSGCWTFAPPRPQP